MFKNVFNDLLQRAFVGIAILLCVSHLWQWFDSGYNIQCLVRAIACFLQLFFILIGHRKGLWVWWVLFAYTVAFFNNFQQYQSFIILMICSTIYSKAKWYLLSTYIVVIFVVCQLHGKEASHLAIHFTNCSVFYVGFKLCLDSKLMKERLVLTLDESKILSKITKGYKAKEIDEFSPNTISRKISNAMKRNGIADKDALLMKFAEEAEKRIEKE